MKYHLWTEREDAILREFYPKELVSAVVAKRLGRGKVSVMRHANILGLRALEGKEQSVPAITT
jgi:hypothetical protein